MINGLDIVSVAASVLDRVRGLNSDKREQLGRVAIVLRQIAECIDRIVDEAGTNSPRVSGHCAELSRYFRAFMDLDLGTTMSKDQRELADTLQQALEFRNGLVASWSFTDATVTDPGRKKQLDENVRALAAAAGHFRAASNLLEATK